MFSSYRTVNTLAVGYENLSVNSVWGNNVFWRPCDRSLWYIPIIKPTRCTNYSNLFLELNSTCFGQFLCPSSGVFSLYTQQWYMSYRFADSLWAGANAPVEFHSKNKFEKIVHLVCFLLLFCFNLYCGGFILFCNVCMCVCVGFVMRVFVRVF